MSLWTHITGAIRFDGMPGVGEFSVEKLKGILGVTCNFESPEEEWNLCTVPLGSEGSLQYHIHEYGTGLPWVVVSVWGDLRDFGSEPEVERVKAWFYGVCKKQGFTRQGILEIEVEGKDPIVLQYKAEEEGVE